MKKTAIKRNTIREGWGSRLFDCINVLFMIFLCVSILLPFWFLLVQSVDVYAMSGGVLHLIPREITFKFYNKVLDSKYIWTGYANTIYRVVLTTALQLFLCSMGAYAISQRKFPHRVFWTFFMLISMFFSAGLIPSFLWMKELGFIDNRLVYVLPGAVSVYNLIMIRNYMQTIPLEMQESAELDGAGEFTIYSRIILPMSKPIIATVTLWVIVSQWNSWFDSLVYMRSGNKQVLQVVLRRIIMEGSSEMLEGANAQDIAVNPDNLKAASIYVTTLPVLAIYPFIQKYFVKGIYVGSLKG